MTREERLKFCSVCKNRKVNYQKGLMCSLTDDFAAFEGECKDYVLDEAEKTKTEEKKEELQKDLKKQDWYNDALFCGMFSYFFAKGFGHDFFLAFFAALAVMVLLFAISNSLLIHFERKRGERLNDTVRILIKDAFALLAVVLIVFLYLP